ncbi:stage II sporulation protein R [Candidatus Epulonipiscium fishelsonii]|uniref:Stage II sporulation protein R n=1 Tax=Candidatus Epulonipiscium fishelsonii TaxID=77094 RepID=A0ACC8XD18_9FIRM|nr:stage II sporulation protein R [Epulopiscium sp. SCG-B05WGA-EpuloA1]ONI40810.1 stage II sporulation protein R [Epulopiscium sp. SCG-B11WGA-EpuloA1]
MKAVHNLLYLGIIAILLNISLFFESKTFVEETSKILSENVLRFHILANSNTPQDQLLKENVRDAVLHFMEPKLRQVTSIEESRELIKQNFENIKQISKQVIADWGKDYKVHIEIAETKFPNKSYGDIIFPAGTYEACRILIGQATGENWWCVMYPPLCYVDAATGFHSLEGKQLLQTLNKEQYEIVSYQIENPYQIKFKILEWFRFR